MPYKDRETQLLHCVWVTMIRRCERPRPNEAAKYRDRGIYVCPEWRHSFAAFVRDMGPRPPGHQIDRIDNDGPYSPQNCRWATRLQNSTNTRQALKIVLGGRTNSLSGWSRELGVPYSTLRKRRARGAPLI